ncbi:MAG TPA: hypothetical protein VH877_08275 [Polyangia bacterium]|jgi:ubiquinone biosynthesis protein Coq4|nr:hypothetical protein [Polyangia bacterium]
MDIAVFDRTELPVVISALRTVALANGSVSETERQLFEIIAQLHGVTLDLDALADVPADTLRSTIATPHRRKRLVQLAVVTSMVDGDPTPAQEEAVRTLATALEIDERSLRVLHHLTADHRLLVRFDVARRLTGGIFKTAYEEEGLAGVGRVLGPLLLGGGEDPEVAWRYRELGLLPAGTLGRVYWEHCTRRHFGFPGEKGGIPERLVFHDFGHVLSGYDTDAEGEIQQGAFQAGFIRQDGFAVLCFVLVHFHLGIRITPIAQAERGLFDPQRVLRALARGAACRVDLSDRWNFWEVVGLPLEEVRARYGIPPLAPLVDGASAGRAAAPVA